MPPPLWSFSQLLPEKTHNYHFSLTLKQESIYTSIRHLPLSIEIIGMHLWGPSKTDFLKWKNVFLSFFKNLLHWAQCVAHAWGFITICYCCQLYWVHQCFWCQTVNSWRIYLSVYRSSCISRDSLTWRVIFLIGKYFCQNESAEQLSLAPPHGMY